MRDILTDWLTRVDDLVTGFRQLFPHLPSGCDLYGEAWDKCEAEILEAMRGRREQEMRDKCRRYYERVDTYLSNWLLQLPSDLPPVVQQNIEARLAAYKEAKRREEAEKRKKKEWR